MSKEKQIIVFFLYNKPGGMHEAGRGVLKLLVMWAVEGNIFI